MNLQSDLAQTLRHGPFPFPQMLLTVPKQQEIVYVTYVSRYPQFTFDEVIKRIEIHIGPQLTGKISDGKPSRPQAIEKFVAGKIWGNEIVFMNSSATCKDEFNEPKYAIVGDFLCQNAVEDIVVDGWEILTNVARKDKGKAAGKVLAAVKRSVVTLASTVCVAVSNKGRFEEWLDHIG